MNIAELSEDDRLLLGNILKKDKSELTKYDLSVIKARKDYISNTKYESIFDKKERKVANAPKAR